MSGCQQIKEDERYGSLEPAEFVVRLKRIFKYNREKHKYSPKRARMSKCTVTKINVTKFVINCLRT
jgi:hypothetical protein